MLTCTGIRESHIGSAGAHSQKEDLLQSKIRSGYWHRCMYRLCEYRQKYSESAKTPNFSTVTHAQRISKLSFPQIGDIYWGNAPLQSIFRPLYLTPEPASTNSQQTS